MRKQAFYSRYVFLLANPIGAHGGRPEKHPQGVDENGGTAWRTINSPFITNAPNL